MPIPQCTHPFGPGRRWLLILLAIASWAASSVRADERVDAWREDLTALAEQLPQRHKNFFFQLDRQDFQRQVALLDQDIPALSDATIMLRMMQLVAAAGDGHTQVTPETSKFHVLPLRFRWFKDGVFVIGADAQNSRALGSRVISIGQVPVEPLIAKLATMIAHDNHAGLKNQAPRYLPLLEALELAGATIEGHHVSVKLELDGDSFELSCQAQPASSVRSLSVVERQPPLCERKPQLDFWNEWLADSKTVYFKYNRCRNALGFGQLVRETAGFIKQNDVQRFVLDLRHNGGGNSRNFIPLRSYLKNHPLLDRRGKLYVIIGRGTFSSAVLNALEMKDTRAIFVGEPSGGKPNHYGEVRTLELPNSKLIVSYSTKYFVRIQDADPPSIEPDLVVESTFADWQAGRDPVLEKILAHQPDQTR